MDREGEEMNKVVVISIDSFISADIETFKKSKNISKLLEKAAIVRDIECIYPTLTYPCHVSIATGVYPDKHGIAHNEVLQIEAAKADWNWWAKDIKVPTIIDLAKEKGYKTATVTWPVMCSSSADYNIGEIWAPTPDADPTEIFDSANSPEVKHIFERHKHMLNWMKTPAFDNFAQECACDIIKEYTPDLMLVHFSYLDHQRHNEGVETHKVLKAIDFIDERVGKVMEACKEAGIYENTNFVLLGDHGQINVKKIFNMNTVLKDMGYITTDENNIARDYKIYAHSCAFSAHVYCKNISVDEAYKVLKDIQERYPQYIEKVYTKEEAKNFHLEGNFDFVLESMEGYTFGKSISKFIEEDVTNEDYKFSTATHGHFPTKGDKPPFILSGPDIKENVEINGAKLVDEACTIMKIFDIEIPNADGHALDVIKK